MRLSQLLNRLSDHWFLWAFLLSGGVLWGLPKLPFYQEGLPYLNDLGGSALVAFYLSLGCLSVCIAVGTGSFSPRSANSSSKALRGLTLSSGGLAVGWMALYLWFMNLVAQ